MEKIIRVVICDKCSSENPYGGEKCRSCGKDLTFIPPVEKRIADKTEQNVKKCENKEVESILLSKRYRKCNACGTKNYLKDNEDVRKCINCGNDELYKCRIEEENIDEPEKKEESILHNVILEKKDDSCLKVKLIEKKTGRILFIQKNVVLGRMGDIDQDLFLNYPYVSRVHCEVLISDGKCYVKAMSAPGGTRVNGVLVQEGKEKILKNGDLLSLANLHFKVNI
ncbi:MAG: FHA domain-containing protein [Clostridium sp.]|nr:FHA domain-containing protein [Clostridium sp.]MCM1207307.1 FHA domain-containing protein [Ruminococcus sp.]